MKITKLLASIAAVGLVTLAGCGGGGGGGSSAPPAYVSGTVLMAPTGTADTEGTPPNPAVTVAIGNQHTTTDVRGNFQLPNVPSDAKQITISGQGILTLTQSLPTLTPNAANDLGTIYIVNTSGSYGASVTGRVVRADTQAPVAGAVVQMNGQSVTTGADGLFSISGLPTDLGGTNVVLGTITAKGFEVKQIRTDLPLGAGANPLPDQPLTAPINSIPGTPLNLFGKVSLQGQTDLSGTTVTLTDRATTQVVGTFTTGSDGRYGFWVGAGSYQVKASHAGFQDNTTIVDLTSQADAKEADLTLTP